MEEYERGPNPETEHDHHYGCAPMIYEKELLEPDSLPINEALEEIEQECDHCEKIKNSALKNGLNTKVLILDHHLVGLVH
jgi:hypothetical protein